MHTANIMQARLTNLDPPLPAPFHCTLYRTKARPRRAVRSVHHWAGGRYKLIPRRCRQASRGRRRQRVVPIPIAHAIGTHTARHRPRCCGGVDNRQERLGRPLVPYLFTLTIAQAPHVDFELGT